MAETVPEQHLDLAPPPESDHATKEALVAYAQTHAAAHGYALLFSKKGTTASRVKWICSRAGRYKNSHKLDDDNRQRNRKSYKTHCRMYIEGREVDVGGYKVWRLKTIRAEHNHEGLSPEQMPLYRKRSRKVLELLKEQFEKGAPHKQAYEELKKQMPGTMVALRDVYNTYTKFRTALGRGQDLIGGATVDSDIEDDNDGQDAVGSPDISRNSNANQNGRETGGMVQTANGWMNYNPPPAPSPAPVQQPMLPPSPPDEPDPLSQPFFRAPDGSLVRTSDLTDVQRLQVQVEYLTRKNIRLHTEVQNIKKEVQKDLGVRAQVDELKSIVNRYVLGIMPT